MQLRPFSDYRPILIFLIGLSLIYFCITLALRIGFCYTQFNVSCFLRPVIQNEVPPPSPKHTYITHIFFWMNALFSHTAQHAGVQLTEQWQLQTLWREYKAGGIKFVVGYIDSFLLLVHILKKKMQVFTNKSKEIVKCVVFTKWKILTWFILKLFYFILLSKGYV